MLQPFVEINAKTLDDLRLEAIEWANHLKPPYVLGLYGDLGAGKTTFTRFVIEVLCGQPVEVTSPTFSLVQIYETPVGPLWHADLYRLNKPQDIVETGLIEAMHQDLCIIEWPELIEPYLAYTPHARLLLPHSKH